MKSWSQDHAFIVPGLRKTWYLVWRLLCLLLRGLVIFFFWLLYLIGKHLFIEPASSFCMSCDCNLFLFKKNFGWIRLRSPPRIRASPRIIIIFAGLDLLSLSLSYFLLSQVLLPLAFLVSIINGLSALFDPNQLVL